MLEDYRKPNGELPFEGIIKRMKEKTESLLNSQAMNTLLNNNRPIYNGVPNNNLDSYNTINRVNWVSTTDMSEYDEYDVDETVSFEDAEDYNIYDSLDEDEYFDNNITNTDENILETYTEERIYFDSPEEQPMFINNNDQPMTNGYMVNPYPPIMNYQPYYYPQPHGHPITNAMPSGYMDVEEVRRLAPPTSKFYCGNNQITPHGHPITNAMPSGYMDVEEVRRLAPPTSKFYCGDNNEDQQVPFTTYNCEVIDYEKVKEYGIDPEVMKKIVDRYNACNCEIIDTGGPGIHLSDLEDEDEEDYDEDYDEDLQEHQISQEPNITNNYDTCEIIDNGGPGTNLENEESYQEPIYANKELKMHSSSFVAKERSKMNLPPQQNTVQQNFILPPINNQAIQYNPYNNPNYNLVMQNAYMSNSYPFNPYNIAPPNNYVFAPAMQYPQNPYGSIYQRPYVDYNNPFPEYNNRQQLLYYGYNNGYNYNPYYRPFMSVQMREQIMKQHTTMGKLRYKIACAGAGIEYKENTADEIFNPMNKINKLTDDDRIENNNWNFVTRAQYYCNNPSPFYMSEPQLTALYIQTYLRNYHEMFDKHSLCEFLEEDYPRLMREFWIADNVKRSGRDLNSTYSSDSYRELLKLHRSSVADHLLNDFNPNQYDNNSQNQDIGVLEMLQFGARKDYKSSHPIMQEDSVLSNPEVQKMKSEFIDSITQQINSKYTAGAARLQHNLVEKQRVDKPVNQETNRAISFMLDQTSTGVIDSN